VDSNFHMARASGWNNLASGDECLEAARARRARNRRVGSGRAPRQPKGGGGAVGGSIWLFKGHANFYFRIRAASVARDARKSARTGGKRKREDSRRGDVWAIFFQ